MFFAYRPAYSSSSVAERLLKSENYQKLDVETKISFFKLLNGQEDRRYFVYQIEQVEKKFDFDKAHLIALGKQMKQGLGEAYALQFVDDSVGFAYRIAQMKQEKLEANRKQLSGDALLLFNKLDKSSDVTYYAYSVSCVLRLLKETKDIEGIKKLGNNIEEKLGGNYKLNVFNYTEKGKTTTYCGFEYRRIDYDKDAALGCNRVVKRLAS